MPVQILHILVHMSTFDPSNSSYTNPMSCACSLPLLLSPGAAAFAAMRAYEQHVSANGAPPNHQFAKEMLAGIIGAEVHRLCRMLACSLCGHAQVHDKPCSCNWCRSVLMQGNRCTFACQQLWHVQLHRDHDTYLNEHSMNMLVPNDNASALMSACAGAMCAVRSTSWWRPRASVPLTASVQSAMQRTRQCRCMIR